MSWASSNCCMNGIWLTGENAAEMAIHSGLAVLTQCAQNEINEAIVLMEGQMPGNLHVRNLDDDLIVRLKRRAQRHGRSTEAEHREILRQVLASEEEASFDKLAADLRKLTKRRKQTPSEELLREGREER